MTINEDDFTYPGSAVREFKEAAYKQGQEDLLNEMMHAWHDVDMHEKAWEAAREWRKNHMEFVKERGMVAHDASEFTSFYDEMIRLIAIRKSITLKHNT